VAGQAGDRHQHGNLLARAACQWDYRQSLRPGTAARRVLTVCFYRWGESSTQNERSKIRAECCETSTMNYQSCAGSGASVVLLLREGSLLRSPLNDVTLTWKHEIDSVMRVDAPPLIFNFLRYGKSADSQELIIVS
jgi:hypothetical protein